MEFIVIVILVIASTVGSALIYFATKKGTQKKLDYDAFAQSKGWQYRFEQTSNRVNTSIFCDPNDSWELQVIFQSGGASSVGGFSGRTERHVVWHCPEGALEGGEAVLGMPIPEKSAAMLQMGGDMGKQILKAALKTTFHALGKTKFDLTIDETTAGDPGGVVMSTPGHAHAMDAFRRNSALADFRVNHKTAETPVLIRDDSGLTLRRPGAVKQLEDITALVDLGKALRTDL